MLGWIIGFIGCVFFVLLALACCKTASEADKTMLKQYKSKED